MASDPWRYQCPECGSHTVQSRVSTEERGAKCGRVSEGRYYCGKCFASFERRYDKKRGELVA